MSPKNIKLSKTQRVLSGVFAATVAMTTTACSTGYENYSEDYSDDYYIDERIDSGTPYVSETQTNEEVVYESEVELNHLQSRYPNLDLEAVEDYLKENGEIYNEEELIAFLDDIEANGEPTTETYYSSSFPWWLFLLSSHPKYSTINSATYVKPNTTTQQSKSTVTQPSTSQSKTSSGFGSSSPATGS